MKILITGSNGFLGKALCSALGEHEIIGYDLPDDITDIDNIREKIKEADIVVHAAAMANLNDCMENMTEMYSVNVKATADIGLLCSYFKTPLIFISTCCVYGNTFDEIEYEDKTLPRTNEPYACSKYAAEILLRGTPYLRYTIVRAGTIYGVGMRKELFPFIALDSVLRGETIHVHGDGEQTRQYIYISDLVDCLKKVIKNQEKVNRETLNVCGNRATSVKQVIEQVETMVGIKAKTMKVTDRYSQIYEEKISISKAYDLLGWFPWVGFRRGMSKLLNEDERFEKYINNNSSKL